jgi:hypothetical protein
LDLLYRLSIFEMGSTHNEEISINIPTTSVVPNCPLQFPIKKKQHGFRKLLYKKNE